MPSEKENTTKVIYIISMLVIFSLAVTWLDAVIQPPYFAKITLKIIFFLLIPFLYFMIWKTETREIKKYFHFDVKDFKISVVLAAVIYGAIVGGFLLSGIPLISAWWQKI